jgi:WD40 repeat protein
MEAAAPFEGHTAWGGRLVISPDGLWMASGGGDSTVIVWNVISRKLERRLLGHIAGIHALAFSPDGRILASGSRDDTIRLWDLKTGQQLALLRGHGAKVTSLGFSPDGQLLVSRGDDGLVKLWQASPGVEGNALTGVPEWLQDARSHDQTVRLWDVSEHKALATLTNGFPVESLAFSPDGRTLIVGGASLYYLVGNRGGLQFWHVPSQQATGTLPSDASGIVEIALSAEGTLLATSHKDCAVSLWDAPSRRLLHRFGSQFGRQVLSRAFSPTEPLLAASGGDGNIVLYNTTTLEVLRPPLKAHTGG